MTGQTPLFGPAAEPKAKKEKARTPPAAWVVRRLLANGIPQALIDANDAKWAFSELARLEGDREAQGLPPSVDDPEFQRPDGFPLPLRLAYAQDLDAIPETATAERLLWIIEGVLPATTTAERLLLIKALALMFREGKAGEQEQAAREADARRADAISQRRQAASIPD